MPKSVYSNANRKYWSETDLLDLDELVRAGYGDHIIARRMGRSYDSVKIARRRKLGLRSGHYIVLSAAAVARALGVGCSKTVVRWIRQGWLRGYRRRRGRSGYLPLWQVTEEALKDFLADPSHWHLWEPEQIPGRYLREWAMEVRGGERYLTAGETAEIFGVETNTVSAWIRKGELRGRKLGPNWRIPYSALEGFTAPVDRSDRKGKARGEWTRDAEALLLNLRSEGLSWTQIAAELGRTVSAVANKHARLRRRTRESMSGLSI